jgi:hypothetical protein
MVHAAAKKGLNAVYCCIFFVPSLSASVPSIAGWALLPFFCSQHDWSQADLLQAGYIACAATLH